MTWSRYRLVTKPLAPNCTMAWNRRVAQRRCRPGWSRQRRPLGRRRPHRAFRARGTAADHENLSQAGKSKFGGWAQPRSRLQGSTHLRELSPSGRRHRCRAEVGPSQLAAAIAELSIDTPSVPGWFAPAPRSSWDAALRRSAGPSPSVRIQQFARAWPDF